MTLKVETHKEGRQNEREGETKTEGGREGVSQSFIYNNFILSSIEVSASLGKSSEKAKLGQQLEIFPVYFSDILYCRVAYKQIL